MYILYMLYIIYINYIMKAWTYKIGHDAHSVVSSPGYISIVKKLIHS